MIEPEMHIVFNSVSLDRMDITTFTIKTWHFDVSFVCSCFHSFAANRYAATAFVIYNNTVQKFLMYFRLGSSLTMSCSGCNVRDIAKMLACMHDGCVLFASISIISLSTCGSHSAWAPGRKVSSWGINWTRQSISLRIVSLPTASLHIAVCSLRW